MTDIEIIHNNKMKKISDIYEPLGIKEEKDFDCYGKYKAKVTENCFKTVENNNDGKLVLVTAISPTPAGEGKTTTSIGLVDGLNKIGIKAIGALREPSMGPVFGIKGGACGGGYSQVQPMEDINLHFMGDFHAITSANNLLCALVDNSIKNGNIHRINPTTIKIKRCLDVNDRQLRNCIIGMNGSSNGYLREEHFQITVASEIMAILCLSNNLKDLKDKISKITIGFTYPDDNDDIFEVKVHHLGITDSIVSVLKDAIRPNLAQTLENNPVIIHGGPFANIAHGCNSIRATKLAMKLADITVTEAGFGADLGAEKFIDIKCRLNNLSPNCIVLVASIRALKYNGGINKEDLKTSNVEALFTGLNSNFIKHYTNLMKFEVPIIVAFNKFDTDSEEEIKCVTNFCNSNNIIFSFSESFSKGGEGSIDLAEKVEKATKILSKIKPLYNNVCSTSEKIRTICCDYYGASRVEYSKKAKEELQRIEVSTYPICIAKTQYSFSDNPKLLGAPKDFVINVKDISVSDGAGFIIVYLGDIMTMPGLPEYPAANKITISDEGVIDGLF